MANRLGVDLEGKTVVLPDGRSFKCEGGFGCRTFTHGSRIFGHYTDTGEKVSISGYDVVRLADAPNEKESKP